MINVVNVYHEKNHEYCGRGSPVGNPFVLKLEKDRDLVCDKYHDWFHKQLILNDKLIDYVDMLFEKAKVGDLNLGCFCAPKRCHCETIKTYLEKRLLEEE
jgi:hypothetical protein